MNIMKMNIILKSQLISSQLNIKTFGATRKYKVLNSFP